MFDVKRPIGSQICPCTMQNVTKRKVEMMRGPSRWTQNLSCSFLNTLASSLFHSGPVLLAKWLVSLPSAREVPGSILTGSRFFCTVTRSLYRVVHHDLA